MVVYDIVCKLSIHMQFVHCGLRPILFEDLFAQTNLRDEYLYYFFLLNCSALKGEMTQGISVRLHLPRDFAGIPALRECSS